MQNRTGSSHASVSSMQSDTRTSANKGDGVVIEIVFSVRGSNGIGGVKGFELSARFNSILIFTGRSLLISPMTTSSLSQLSIRKVRPQFRLRPERPKNFFAT
jgi:hypothetical protein